MQFVQFIAARADTGAVLPYANVSVCLADTQTVAELFDKDGDPIANPATCDAIGAVGFAAADGLYDIYISSKSGDYSVPPIYSVQIVDLAGYKNSVTGYLADAQAAASQAQSALIAAEGAAGVSKTYLSYADANADLANIGANDFARVLVDETNGGSSAIYQKQGGALVAVSVDRAFITLPAPSGGDDAAMINAVLGALAAPGARIAARKGATYQFASPIVVPSHTTLDLSGAKCEHVAGSGATGNMIVNAAYMAAATNVTITWTSGDTCSVAWPNHGFVVGDYVWLMGADQAQYHGVFPVGAVTDANNFVVNLRRVPSAAPTTTTFGDTIRAKKADRDIRIIGANVSRTYTSSTSLGTHAIIMAGIEGLHLDQITSVSSEKYALLLCAITNARVTRFSAPATNSDVLKGYGPLFNVVIDGVAGISGDDFLTLQPREHEAYASYRVEWGDIIGVTVRNIYCADAAPARTVSLAAIYTTTSGAIITDVTFDGIYGRNLNNAAVAILSNIGTGFPEEVGGACGHVRFLRCGAYGKYGLLTRNSAIERIDWQVSGGGPLSATGNFGFIDAGTSIKEFNLVDWAFEAARDAPYLTAPVGFNHSGAIDVLNMINCRISFPAGKFFAFANGATIGQVNIRDSWLDLGTGWLFQAGTSVVLANTPVINIERNDLKASYLLDLATSYDFSLDRNTINVGAIFRALKPNSGSIAINYRTRANNRVAGSWFAADTATTNVTVYPYSDEAVTNVDAAYIGRAEGAHLNNNRVSIGTITETGIVDCHGTAANSWRVRGDPVAQRY